MTGYKLSMNLNAAQWCGRILNNCALVDKTVQDLKDPLYLRGSITRKGITLVLMRGYGQNRYRPLRSLSASCRYIYVYAYTYVTHSI